MSIGAELGQYTWQTHNSEVSLGVWTPLPHLGSPVIGCYCCWWWCQCQPLLGGYFYCMVQWMHSLSQQYPWARHVKVTCVGVYTVSSRHRRRTSQMTYPLRLLMATAVTSDLPTLKLWWLGRPDSRPPCLSNDSCPCLEHSSTSRQGCAISLLSFWSRLKTWLFELTLA